MDNPSSPMSILRAGGELGRERLSVLDVREAARDSSLPRQKRQSESGPRAGGGSIRRLERDFIDSGDRRPCAGPRLMSSPTRIASG